MSAQFQGDPDKRLSTTDLSSPRWSNVRRGWEQTYCWALKEMEGYACESITFKVEWILFVLCLSVTVRSSKCRGGFMIHSQNRHVGNLWQFGHLCGTFSQQGLWTHMLSSRTIKAKRYDNWRHAKSAIIPRLTTNCDKQRARCGLVNRNTRYIFPSFFT